MYITVLIQSVSSRWGDVVIPIYNSFWRADDCAGSNADDCAGSNAVLSFIEIYKSSISADVLF